VGSNLSEDDEIFKVDKNSKHNFLLRGAKAVGPMLWIYSMLKNLMNMKEIICRKNSAFPFHVPPTSLLGDFTGRITRELCWMNHEFSPVDIIPPWPSVLIYITWGNEQ
jgi:hypothetical protein